MRKVSTLTLSLCLLSIPSFLAAWLIEHFNPYDSFFAGPLFFITGIVLLVGAACGEVDRLDDFRKIFGFDPRPSKRELVGSPQLTVSQLVEARRQHAVKLFREEIELRRKHHDGQLDSTAYNEAFNNLCIKKLEAKKAFWAARNNAHIWGFEVPNSITESAIPQPQAV